MSQSPYIAIEGVIGVGKTTLARLLAQEFGGELLLEVFEENPFLRDFYADRARYAFQTQIFFLLSRYRQQHGVVQRLLRKGTLISDYTFAKDRIFAHLNLQNDELQTYERLHGALSENVVTPDLIVYLYADLDTVMERIATRDRTYERNMETDYIRALGERYESFLADYDESPVLRIDTSHLNIVRDPESIDLVVQSIRSALGHGTHQPELPQLRPLGAMDSDATGDAMSQMRRLTDLQNWHRQLEARSDSPTSPYYSLLQFQANVGQLAEHLARTWATEELLQTQRGDREQVPMDAVETHRDGLQQALTDCMTSILRISNELDIDLEQTYLRHLYGHDARDEENA